MGITAVFGGTFNPFHIGHYEILKCLCEQDWIDEVLLMPDKIPPHKTCNFLASDEDRIEMCKIACEDLNKATLSLIEFEREGKSYTVHTVDELKRRYPNKKFAFVCGGDMIDSLDTWYNFDRLKKEISFIAFERKDLKDFAKSVEKMTLLGADIKVISKDITPVSSSSLRKNLNSDYIPKKIYKYIVDKGIYNEK